jgi:hypothetical protein
MPVLTGPVRADGALVPVRVALSRPLRQALRRGGRPVPPPVDLLALLDPGAECTCIDPRSVRSLPLPIAGFGLVNAPSLAGVSFGRSLQAGLTVSHPDGAASSLEVPELTVVELDLGQLGYKALVGRDVLARCMLVYDGPAGRFTLAY